MTALSFLIVRIVLAAAFERDLEYDFVSATNKAVIAAIAAECLNITAAAVNLILESLVYVYFTDGKPPSNTAEVFRLSTTATVTGRHG